MTLIESVHLKRLAEELDRLSQQTESGILILSSHTEEGSLYFSQGQLLYATSHIHRVRRWSRSVDKYCPKITVKLPSSVNSSLWEYKLLYQGIRRQELNLTQAKAVIRRVISEVLFSMSRYVDFKFHWEAQTALQSGFSKHLSFCDSEVKKILLQVTQMQTQWQTAHLSNLDPNLAPIFTKPVNPKALSGLVKYLNGELTLWDISLKIQKPIVTIARALIPLVQKGLLKFRMLPDLAAQTDSVAEQTNNLTVQNEKSSTRKQPLIACIDDSLVAIESLKQILEPVGCQILSIQNPVKGLAKIAEHKPDLIFLDLVMPNANGYIVCKFLRNAPIFQNTPVIILTSRDTVVDRNYAKIAGATDFLSKPPNPRETLQVVRQHLAEKFPLLKTYNFREGAKKDPPPTSDYAVKPMINS
ncbi:two-component system response regulator [Lyngbya sp. PCC 8106]|uniref:response regulator n=1 Tax=Lyngbya sp. (strain PCC 8106) TaxID=313612 RepID=UPI0000EACA03|nr:response regulator [Lyngbya sp. PCC 8106]EAW37939.1 PatA subfamily protein [Lyngbya sp. PCC 8106]